MKLNTDRKTLPNKSVLLINRTVAVLFIFILSVLMTGCRMETLSSSLQNLLDEGNEVATKWYEEATTSSIFDYRPDLFEEHNDVAPWEGQPESDEEIDTSVSSALEYDAYENFDFSSIPEYSGEGSIVINDDIPMFTDEQRTYNGTYISLSPLDNLGRCQVAYGCVGQETQPSDGRGDISAVHPSGWVQHEYDGQYLYNRSHLLMFALTGLNDDERNLITGTEYFNQILMLGWESLVLTYVDNFNGHVMYRVTPVFEGDCLVAKGVLMEAYSIEFPEEATFCRFVYNVANPDWNVEIDYATGNSYEVASSSFNTSVTDAGEKTSDIADEGARQYVINRKTGKFHLPSCASVETIREENRVDFLGTRDELIAMDYSPCGSCKP